MNIEGLDLILYCFYCEVKNGADPLSAMKEAFTLYAEQYCGYNRKMISQNAPVRPVKVFRLDEKNKHQNGHLKKVFNGEGYFHGWGSDFKEFEDGAVQITTAIVEMKDGSVKSLPVELIQFLDAEETNEKGDQVKPGLKIIEINKK